MGEAAGATGVQARAQGTQGRGEAQAVEELQHAWADIQRRLERVERAVQDGERQGERAQGSEGTESCRPLQPFSSQVSRWRPRGRCKSGPGRGLGARQRGWSGGTGRWRSGTAG